MNWLEKVSSEDLFDDQVIDHGVLKIDQLELRCVGESNIISDFFILLNTGTGRDGVTSLPVPNDKALDQIMSNIAPHFKLINVEKINNRVEVISLQSLKEESLNSLETKEINSILTDFFKNEKEQLDFDRSKPVPSHSVYKINKDFLKKMEDSEAEELFSCLSNMFSNTKDLLFKPQNWVLSDKIQDYSAIQFFGHRCTGLYLWVDNDTNIIFDVHLKFG